MDLAKAVAIADMGVRASEGCALVSYQDSGGRWTLGYGHIAGVTAGMTCTSDQAIAWLDEDLMETTRYVLADLKRAPTTNQLAALIQFTFNEGEGHLRGSTLLRLYNFGQYDAASAEFPKWDKCRGAVVQGLLNRRLREQALFLTPDA